MVQKRHLIANVILCQRNHYIAPPSFVQSWIDCSTQDRNQRGLSSRGADFCEFKYQYSLTGRHPLYKKIFLLSNVGLSYHTVKCRAGGTSHDLDIDGLGVLGSEDRKLHIACAKPGSGTWRFYTIQIQLKFIIKIYKTTKMVNIYDYLKRNGSMFTMMKY